MTIAIGFRYDNGILLCADREVTEGISKFSQCKIFGEQVSSTVSLAFALSGTIDYAEMALQEITAVIKSSRLNTHIQIRTAISDTIRDIYNDAIGGLMEAKQADVGFSFLIGVWVENQLKLYVSDDTAVKEVPQIRCIGVGKELAKYILSRDGVRGSDRMPLQTAETIALRILKHVKEGVSGCGKESDILILDAQGGIAAKSQNDYLFESRLIDLYDDTVSVMLPFAVELNMSERERQVGFHMALSNYFRKLADIQAEKMDSGSEN